MRRSSNRARADALALLRRYPGLHDQIAGNVPAARQLLDGAAGRWVASLGLDPAEHGLPGKPPSRAATIARRLEAEAVALLHTLAGRARGARR